MLNTKSTDAVSGNSGGKSRHPRALTDVYAKLALMERAIEHLNQGFCIFDRHHRLVTCNSRYAQMYRLPPELTRPGTPLRLILERRFEIGDNPSGDRDACIRLWTEGVNATTVTKTMVGFKDGRTLCRDHLPLPDGGFVSIFEDVTEGLRTAGELDRMKSFLDAVVNTIPATIMVKEARDRRYIFANRSAERYLGRSSDELIGRTAAELFRPDDAKGVEARDDEVLRSEKGRTFHEYTIVGRDGDIRHHTSRRVVMRDPSGRPAFILLVVEDVTERRRTEHALERTQSFLDTVIDNIPAIVLVKDARDSRYNLVNRAAEKFFGVPRGEMLGKNCHDIFSQREAEAIMARDAAALGSGEELTVSENALDIPGRGTRQVSVKRLVLRDAAGIPQSIVQVLEDQTDRLEIEADLNRARNFLDAVIENIPLPIFVKDARDLRYLMVNRLAEDVIGRPRAEIIGKTTGGLGDVPGGADIDERDREALARPGEVVIHELDVTRANGEARSVIVKRLTVDDAAGEPRYLIVVSEDVTERRRSAERIAYMAHHDTLTGLPNRASFNEHLTRTFERAAETGESFAVLCLDIDRFKEINDVFGHSVGDEFLQTVSARLQGAAQGAFVARLGGDEFTMVTACGPQPATAEALVERLFEQCVGDVDIQGHQLRIGLSVGVSVYPDDASEESAILSNADAALYRAKREGRNTFRFFDAEMDRRTREHHALQHDLRVGISRGELILHYQPLARIGGEIIGFEALLRWNHPVRGLVPPGSFIPAAEENGLIVAVGEWTLRAACREAASWKVPLQIAVNLSPVQFRYGDLPKMVHEVLLETGLPSSRLELEITEGALIGDFSRALSILRRLKSLGVKIAMDDFGTGYSSLSYLQSFPFDKIKIDRSFIVNLHENPQSATIVRAVIGLARGLDMPVIAEGVETKEQLDFLTQEACDEMQGHLIGRAAPISEYWSLTGAVPIATRRALLVG
jgi:diguanylate cyclase (GGDEF)-like protein/PAS domain S-box-containing protein